MAGDLPDGWSEHVEGLIGRVNTKEDGIAPRKASQNAIPGIAA